MSTPATEPALRPVTDLLELPGQRALSRFRLERLAERLRDVHSGVRTLDARYVYFVELLAPLAAAARARLDALLIGDDGRADLPPWALNCFVVPRPGTVSPWSSKATDILRVCDLDAVRRVERGLQYAIDLRQGRSPSAAEGPSDDTLAVLAPVLHDRMTEAVFADSRDAARLFAGYAPEPLGGIAFGEHGETALRRANDELGLALADDEIAYLVAKYTELGRDPTDAELMMFAQANSEHCRHKIFNATWTIDGEEHDERLFAMIRATTAANPDGVVSAYSDNAAVIEGSTAPRLYAAPQDREYRAVDEPIHILLKVETHNHPTAISPFPGAATGAGGEIRDEGATGLGARPKAGLTGFSVSHLRVPGYAQPWEIDFPRSERMAAPLEIMLDGPIGAAAFNNEFGRPNLCGYFRSFEAEVPGLPAREIRGYHKPIMIAGGVGNVREEHARKRHVPVGARLVVIGGPAMLIGLGGGAASSLASGTSAAALDFASVQRGNPEMQRRAQEVIDRCSSMGADNPILLIHDVGAGGLANAVPEAVDHGKHGAMIELREIANAEPGMSPMGIWCNEAQERYVLLVGERRIDEFRRVCARERCPVSVIGTLTADGRLTVTDRAFGNRVVDLPLDMLLGKPPKMHREVRRAAVAVAPLDLAGIEVAEAIARVLRFPAVADKSFLIHIGDRTVGGLSVRDQLVGPWQVPVSDVAICASSFQADCGEAMAIGERTPLAVIDAPASGRMAIAEAITNIAAAPIESIARIRLSANWMAAAGHAGEDARLFATVQAVATGFCQELGIAIPVGKDSLSMQACFDADDKPHRVVAPVSLIVSAFAPIADVRRHLTPELRRIDEPSCLLLFDLGEGRNRLGASVLAQAYRRPGGETPDIASPVLLKRFFAAIQELNERGLLLAYHDRSDGGLVAAVCEMMFASRLGVSLELSASGDALLGALFSEEAGAIAQVARSRLLQVRRILARHGIPGTVIGRVEEVGSPNAALTVRQRGHLVTRIERATLERQWSELSYRMQALRDNPETAREEYDRKLDDADPGLHVSLSFNPEDDAARPLRHTPGPRVAILREQGVNSQYEMANAFLEAGFVPVDVHMSDLLEGRDSLAGYQGLAACGGFSFGDVLGAGGGWAKSILFNDRMRDDFQAFFARRDSFALGVCNGCQMFAHLKGLIPGAGHWPRFLRNRSEQFEARLSLVEVVESPSLFLAGMAGSRLPIATSHGEGRVAFESDTARLAASHTVALRYVDNHGCVTERYPANPNGSVDGICGLSSDDGRVTIMMPHPERVVLTRQHSWHPLDWGRDGPWLRMFRNLRLAVG